MSVERILNGVGLPPPKVIVPAVFEKAGSVVQSENAEPVLETFTTDSFVLSNVSDASTALTLSPAGSATMDTVNVCPEEYEPDAGDTRRSAAKARSKEKRKKKKEKTANTESCAIEVLCFMKNELLLERTIPHTCIHLLLHTLC
jgi:hypothetical protein